jgi:hypothetical protein
MEHIFSLLCNPPSFLDARLKKSESNIQISSRRRAPELPNRKLQKMAHVRYNSARPIGKTDYLETRAVTFLCRCFIIIVNHAVSCLNACSNTLSPCDRSLHVLQPRVIGSIQPTACISVPVSVLHLPSFCTPTCRSQLFF